MEIKRNVPLLYRILQYGYCKGIQNRAMYSFQDLLDFCVEQNCFTQAQATTLYDFTIVFDSLDDNYHEFDRQKLLTLYDAIGIPENMQAAI